MYRKLRNDNSSKVEKYKKQIDRINKLNGSVIIYNDKTANVEVPNFATGGVEYYS